MGTAVAAVVWDQRYNYHLQQYAEETPLDSFGFTGVLSSLQHTLQWSGEIAALIPTKTMALIRDRLFAEASTAAWQDFFWFNAMVAIFCLFPALPFWRRRKYEAPSTLPTAADQPRVPGRAKATPSPKGRVATIPTRTIPRGWGSEAIGATFACRSRTERHTHARRTTPWQFTDVLRG